jgi:hypothetical protein
MMDMVAIEAENITTEKQENFPHHLHHQNCPIIQSASIGNQRPVKRKSIHQKDFQDHLKDQQTVPIART